MKFDEVLDKHIGNLGKFQILVLLLLGYEELFMTLQTIAPVFIAGTPKHYWCRHPQLYNDTIFGNCSLEERLHITVPPGMDVTDNDGLSHCTVYDTTFEPGSCESRLGEYQDPVVTGTAMGHKDPGETTPAMGHKDPGETTPAMGHKDPGETTPAMGLDANKHSITNCSSGWIFDQSVVHSTMVTEWQLVCSGYNKVKAKSIISVFLAGRAVGNLFFGWIADRFGRRIVILAAGIASVTTGLISAFIPTYIPFVFLRFFQAFFATGKTNTGFILAMEYSGPTRRIVVGSIYFLFWSGGMIVLSGIAYFVRQWRYLLIAVTIPEYLIYIIFYFTVPESPRWLYLRNRNDEADQIVNKMAKTNGVTLPKDIEISEKAEKCSSVNPMNLLRTPRIRLTSLILFFVWSVFGLIYYGLTFNTGDLSGNIYINTALNGIIEIPACILMIPVLAYVGRIPILSGSTIIGAVMLLLAMIFQEDTAMQSVYTALVMIGRLFILVAFNLVWMYCGECYPTYIRSMGVTVTALGARIFAPISPYVILLSSFYSLLPSILFGGLGLVAGLLILILPETRGHPMPQTIAEGELFIKENRINCCGKRTPKAQGPVMNDDHKDAQEMECLNGNNICESGTVIKGPATDSNLIIA